MPKITFNGKVIECETGDNLRKVLMREGLPLYNGVASAIHCRGLGTCGTCALKIEGEVSPTTAVERWRLRFPPHEKGTDLRLACQCKVLGDLKLEKFDGLWGHRIANQTKD
jgi:ferredoxin